MASESPMEPARDRASLPWIQEAPQHKTLTKEIHCAIKEKMEML